MKKREGDIIFTQQIIKEVAVELGFTTAQVQGVYDSMVKYLHYLVNETPSVAIFIPHMGTLHIKVGYVFDKIRKAKSSTRKSSEKVLEIFTKKKEVLDKYLQEVIPTKGSIRVRHLQKSRIFLSNYTDGKNMAEIEEIQNKRQ